VIAENATNFGFTTKLDALTNVINCSQLLANARFT